VQRAVASVLAQTYRDYELIVVDDGSTDGTEEALAPLSGLRYHWQPNAGVSAARNAGIRLAHGPIIAFLDSDNRWLPDHLEVVSAVLERHPDAVLASTCPNFIVAGRAAPDEACVLDHRSAPLMELARVGHLSCVAVRREALVAVGGFDERMEAFEDIDLWMRLALRGSIATVRRRTIVAQATPGSLRHRARQNGHYLAAAELSATKLVAAAEQLHPQRRGLLDEARGGLHLARAMRAVERNDAVAVRRELEEACRLTRLSALPEVAESPIRRHLTGAQDPYERLRALKMVAELWPDDRADSARYMRGLAVVAALQARRPREAARLARSWPVDGTAGFVRRIGPVLHRRALRSWQDYRNRGR
jgi:hypothetical protein